MNIKTLFILFFVCLCLLSNAQDKKIKKAIKYLSEGKYENSREEIDEYQNKNPESAIGFYAAYLWFSDKKNEEFNPDIAYNFLNRSKELERKLETALRLEYCAEFNFCKDSLDYLREKLGRTALDHLKEKSATLDQIEGFLLLYKDLKVYKNALDYRDSTALMLAVAEKSPAAIENFMRKYPKSNYSAYAKEYLYEASYNEAKELNTEEAYLKHNEKYKKSLNLQKCLSAAIELNYREAQKQQQETAFILHIKKYSESPFKKEAYNSAVELNYSLAKNQNTEASYLQHIADYPDSKYAESCMKTAADIAFASLSETSTLEDLEHFLKKYPNSKHKTQVSEWLQKQVELKKDEDFYDMLKNYKSKLASLDSLFHPNGSKKNEEDVNNPYPWKLSFSIGANGVALVSTQNNYEGTYTFNYSDGSSFTTGSMIHINWANIYLLDFLSKFTLDELADYCLQNSYFKRFFAKDRSRLIDIIKYNLWARMYIMDKPVFNPSAWGPLFEDLAKDQDGNDCSNGFNFYSQSTSEFGTSAAGPAIIYYKGKQFSPEVFAGISMLRIPSCSYLHLFEVKNQKGKVAIFNTKSGKFITDWVDDIDYQFIKSDNFKEDSPTANLINIISNGQLFVYYILKEKIETSNNSYYYKYKAVNSNGEEVIDPNLFPNMNFNNISHCCDIKESEYFTFTRNNTNTNTSNATNYGICNNSFDTIILDAKYTDIGRIDYYNNLDLRIANVNQKLGSNAKIYNLDKKQFLPIANNVGGIQRIYFPTFSNLKDYENKNIIERRYNQNLTDCGSLEDILLYKATLINSQGQNGFGFESGFVIYDRNGKEIYNSNGRWDKILGGTEKVIVIRKEITNNPKNIVLKIDGTLIWDPPRDYEMKFLTENHIIFYYETKDGAGSRKYYGLYQIGKGITQEAIFENVRIEKGACYGIKLGKETLIWSE